MPSSSTGRETTTIYAPEIDTSGKLNGPRVSGSGSNVITFTTRK